MILKYKIKFFDYWHLSSGLSGGAKFDSIVVKDGEEIPYVPAKTVKGLAREMAELLDKEFALHCFGLEGVDMGRAYFANATLDDVTKEEIVTNKLQDNLYDVIASTQIGEKGIAVDDSLREIEVVIPMTFEGQILDIEKDDDLKNMQNSLKMIKRMGLNRNRGLGRCEFYDFEVEAN